MILKDYEWKKIAVDQGLFEKWKENVMNRRYRGVGCFIVGLQVSEKEVGKYNDYEGKWIANQGFIWKHEKENGMKILLT